MCYGGTAHPKTVSIKRCPFRSDRRGQPPTSVGPRLLDIHANKSMKGCSALSGVEFPVTLAGMGVHSK